MTQVSGSVEIGYSISLALPKDCGYIGCTMKPALLLILFATIFLAVGCLWTEEEEEKAPCILAIELGGAIRYDDRLLEAHRCKELTQEECESREFATEDKDWQQAGFGYFWLEGLSCRPAEGACHYDAQYRGDSIRMEYCVITEKSRCLSYWEGEYKGDFSQCPSVDGPAD